jgi:hypothetical protein
MKLSGGVIFSCRRWIKTIEWANDYLANDYLMWWERELTVEPAKADDDRR